MSMQPSFFSVFVCVCISCHSVNINHNSLCCQIQSLRLRHKRRPTASDLKLNLKTICFPLALQSPPRHFFFFFKCGFGSNEEKKKKSRAWADGVHRQTWEASATAASQTRTDGFEGGGGKTLDQTLPNASDTLPWATLDVADETRAAFKSPPPVCLCWL